MNKWLRQAAKNYQIELSGKKFNASKEEVIALIRDKLKKSPVVRNLFSQFDVSPNQLDSLSIEIVPLADKYAITDGDVMKLDEDLFTKDDGFFSHRFFIVVHEIVHFLSRKREETGYFGDPEEGLAFTAAIADYLGNGRSEQEVWRDIYPKTQWHFHDETEAEQFFKKCIFKAQKLI